MGQLPEKEPDLERNFELERFRLKLWDKFISIHLSNPAKDRFDNVWYNFLLTYYASGLPLEDIYQDAVEQMEKIHENHL